MKRLLNDPRWLGAVTTLMLVGISWLAARDFVPAWLWFEVRSVHVADVSPFGDPVMQVDRRIHRRFHGEWHVTVRREIGNTLTTVCNAGGESEYVPGAVLPETITLSWWMRARPEDCRLIRPGLYRVDTRWRISAGPFGVKEVAVTSNTFRVLDR